MAARRTPQPPTTAGHAWGNERVRLGLSLRKLSALSGVSRTTLSLAEQGRLIPTGDEFRAVMDALRDQQCLEQSEHADPFDRWIEKANVAGHLYTTHECGCLVLVMLDMPDVVKDARDDILRESLAGRTLKRCGRGELPPLNCSAHQRVPA